MVPDGHRAVSTAGGPSDAPDSNASRFITLEELDERLLDQQRQHEHTHLRLLKRLDTLTQANEQLQRNFAQRLTQLQTQHQQQQAGWQEELQGATEDNLHQAHQHIEQVDRTGRLSSLVMKGIRAPAGGRGALTLHVQDLLLTHAGVAKQSIADVSCIGPIRAAGVKLVRVRFTSAAEKHAAFRASSTLRRQKIFLDDDLTQAQQARRRQLEPARRTYMSQGMPAWWRGDTLLYRLHGEVKKHGGTPKPEQHASSSQRQPDMRSTGSAPSGHHGAPAQPAAQTSPLHPLVPVASAAAVAGRSDAGGHVNQAPPSGAIATAIPPPGSPLPPPPPHPPVAPPSIPSRVPRQSYASATAASPPSGSWRQRRKHNQA